MGWRGRGTGLAGREWRLTVEMICVEEKVGKKVFSTDTVYVLLFGEYLGMVVGIFRVRWVS